MTISQKSASKVMKKQINNKKTGLTIISLFFFLASFSQTTNELYNTWYEWPHETEGGNNVYKTSPYVPVPGIDHQYDVYKKLVIQNSGAIKVGQYCGYCPNVNLVESIGNFTISEQKNSVKNIIVTYPNMQANIIIDIYSYSVNKLVLKFQSGINTN